jgi:hypothetical protein
MSAIKKHCSRADSFASGSAVCLMGGLIFCGGPAMLESKSLELDFAMEQASVGLEKILVQSLRLAPSSEAPLLAWPVVCGSGVAERTRALSFENGVLRVQVASARWNAELQSLAPRYLAAINRYSSEPVSRIEFVVVHPEEIKTSR